MSNVQPGWLPDPSDGTLLRWWDGLRWTEHTAPNGMTASAQLKAPGVRASRRMPTWGWALIGLASLISTILLAPLVAVIAAAVLITAIICLSRGSRTWLRLSSRKSAMGVVAGASVVLLFSGGLSAAMTPRVTTEPAVAEAQRFAGSVPSSESVAATPTPTTTPTPTPTTTTREDVVTEAIPFERTTIEDAATPRGQNSVTTNGQNGERALTYRVTLVDGVETGRELVSDVVTLAAVSEVTTAGTYDAPPLPAPVTSNCDPNYADACVPIASDVDCAWGSGDGPAYFDGVARVVGTDVYGLDRDKDGWACEQ